MTTQIGITAGDLRTLFERAKQSGNLEAFCRLALEWAMNADIELRRLRELCSKKEIMDLRIVKPCDMTIEELQAERARIDSEIFSRVAGDPRVGVCHGFDNTVTFGGHPKE